MDENCICHAKKNSCYSQMSSKTVTFRPTKKAKKVVPTKKPRMTGVKTYGEMSTAASKVMNNAESAVNPQRNRALKKLQKQKKKDAKRISKWKIVKQLKLHKINSLTRQQSSFGN